MQSTFQFERDSKLIRRCLGVFMAMLIVSGITAMPAEKELSFAVRIFDADSLIGSWLTEILFAVKDTSKQYPYLFYGYDWLAFAHIIIAIAFIGPYKDPVKNKWVIELARSLACS